MSVSVRMFQPTITDDKGIPPTRRPKYIFRFTSINADLFRIGQYSPSCIFGYCRQIL